MSWTTFYGRKIEYSQMSHQHLSNITWYFKIILNSVPPLDVLMELDMRFGGFKLPYRPLHSFNYEIDFLFNKGYITDKHQSNIVVDGQWIGELAYT